MKIGVMGAGVVGGSLAAVLEDEDFDVAIYDPFKGYEDLTVMADRDVVFVCVWTPTKDGRLDTSTVFDAVKSLSTVLPPGAVIAVRSTVIPGFMTYLMEQFSGFHFAFVPEFLVEADPIGSMRKADRIVVGAGITKSRVLQNIMQKVTPGAPVAVVSPEEAVMVKLASNGLLAAKVAIANELSEICELYGVDWDNVRGAVGLDRRIGPDHLHVTEERGYGGSCFPKDVQGLIGAAKDKGGRAAAFEVIQSTNEQRRRAAADAMYFMSSVGFR